MAERTAAAEAETTRPDPRSALSVRRAVLPWRRKVRNLSDFDFTPKGFTHWSGDALGQVLLIFMFPFYLPVVLALVVGAVEFLLSMFVLPLALLWRKLRKVWPVEVLDRRGRPLERTTYSTWAAAGVQATQLREERKLLRWR